MNKVLITGGKGLVGGRISKKLSGSFHIVLSSRNKMDLQTLQLHGAESSLLHDDLLQKENFPNGINTVIHMAALNEWDCVEYPSEAIRVNIDQTRIILENAIGKGVQQFIYFSTAHVYGRLSGIVSEQSIPFPNHPYAITHRAAEDYVISAGAKGKIHSVVLRLSNSFGAPVSPDVNRWTLLANDLARQSAEKKKLTLLSSGCQYRDFVCLTDVAEVVSKMVEQDVAKLSYPIYNLGSGKSVKVLDMAGEIARIYNEMFGADLPIQLPSGSLPSKEDQFQFDISRLVSEGFNVSNDVSSELKSLIQFCKNHFSFND